MYIFIRAMGIFFIGFAILLGIVAGTSTLSHSGSVGFSLVNAAVYWFMGILFGVLILALGEMVKYLKEISQALRNNKNEQQSFGETKQPEELPNVQTFNVMSKIEN